MPRELTKKEKEWINNFKRCLRDMPKTINLYISNCELVFQIYDTNTKEVLEKEIKHGFEQGDPMIDVFNMDRC